LGVEELVSEFMGRQRQLPNQLIPHPKWGWGHLCWGGGTIWRDGLRNVLARRHTQVSLRDRSRFSVSHGWVSLKAEILS
jgi:hypothetical protein